MEILYIHGFGSQFDSNSEKVKALKNIGEVSGVDIDYSKEIGSLVNYVGSVILERQIDLLVGTSMGGYLSALLGAKYGIPFVAINPVTNPRESLKKYLGTGTTYYGTDYFLSEETVNAYDPIVSGMGACGLVLLDEGDEVLDSRGTRVLLEPSYPVKIFEGGCHRFSHINESLEEIRNFYNKAGLIYGFGDA